MSHINKFSPRHRLLAVVAVIVPALSGCWLAAGAVGAEAGYIASQDKRTAGETIDDQVIHSSIKSSMLADSEVSGLKINVDVNRGNVELRGYVPTQHEIDRAVEIAQKTKGVASVKSLLVLDRRY